MWRTEQGDNPIPHTRKPIFLTSVPIEGLGLRPIKNRLAGPVTKQDPEAGSSRRGESETHPLLQPQRVVDDRSEELENSIHRGINRQI